MTEEHPAITALMQKRGLNWPPEMIEAYPSLYRQIRALLVFDPEATDEIHQALTPQYNVTRPIEAEAWAAKDERIRGNGGN